MKDVYETELTKILAKVMQSSFRRKEMNDKMNAILDKIDSVLQSNDKNEDVEELKREFNEIKYKYENL